jgi:hypothetical protein
MTVGVAVATANSLLNVFRGVTMPGLSLFMKVHVGDPGAAGTANPSATTTRNAVTWAAASGGSMALSSIGTYAMTTTETASHVSFWDAATSGTFLESAALSSGVPVINGSTLTFTVITLAYTPIAA